MEKIESFSTKALFSTTIIQKFKKPGLDHLTGEFFSSSWLEKLKLVLIP